jgi:hypothetical protein
MEMETYSNLHTAEKRGRIDVARNMKSEGMPVETISRLTNLSIKEIERL